MLQRLVLTTTSLHNVVISNDSDVIYYEVVTPKWDRHLTTISRLNPNTREFDVIGELQNENDKPVGVRINAYGDDIQPASDFLKADTSQGNQSWGFKGKDGRQYVWRTKGRRLELIQEGNPEAKPVAVHCRHKRHLFVLKMRRPPYIEIDTSVMDTLDTLILSFLLMERKRRDHST